MQLNCSIASLNRLRDAITARALHSNCIELRIPPSGDENTDSATRSQRVQSFVTHGIADKAIYLSEATK